MPEPISGSIVTGFISLTNFARDLFGGRQATPEEIRATNAARKSHFESGKIVPQSRAEGDETFTFRITQAELDRRNAESEQRARERQQEFEQAANLLALRPAAQLTREPVPVRVRPPITAPVSVVPREAAQVTREPVPVETEEKDMANGFELLPFLNTVGQTAQALGGLFGGARASAPAPMMLTGAGVVRGAASVASGANFLGFGGGNGTPLQRARDATGRGVSRKQIILAARHCGLEVASETFGISVTDVCMVVAKGMPRRSRGISSTDMRRTRSTLTKMNTMTKSLRGLCPPARRRS